MDITFAEDREFSNTGSALKELSNKIEDTFTAVAFAEAGEFENAANYINKDGDTPKIHGKGYKTKRFTKLCTGKA